MKTPDIMTLLMIGVGGYLLYTFFAPPSAAQLQAANSTLNAASSPSGIAAAVALSSQAA